MQASQLDQNAPVSAQTIFHVRDTGFEFSPKAVVEVQIVRFDAPQPLGITYVAHTVGVVGQHEPFATATTIHSDWNDTQASHFGAMHHDDLLDRLYQHLGIDEDYL